MYRDFMPANSGMLFIYRAEMNGAAFWMKNTYIPLDMLFIDSKGVVRHIHDHAKPLDETHIVSEYPTRMVLELNAGGAQSMDIRVGDQIFLPFALN